MTSSNTSEHDLNADFSCVLASDYNLVRDVCVVLSSVCKNVSVTALEHISIATNAQIYHVSAAFVKGQVVEISKGELDTIVEVNPLRVLSVSVFYDGERVHIKAKVCGYDHPITVTSTDIVKIVKKRRWLNIF